MSEHTWLDLLSYIWGGILLANAITHFVSGMMGRANALEKQGVFQIHTQVIIAFEGQTPGCLTTLIANKRLEAQGYLSQLTYPNECPDRQFCPV